MQRSRPASHATRPPSSLRVLCLMALGLAGPTVAMAAPIMLGNPGVEGVPDGSSRLRIWSSDVDPAATVRIRASLGSATDVQAAADGTITFHWTPPEDGKGGTETLSVRYRTKDGAKAEHEVSFPVAAAPAVALVMTPAKAVVAADDTTLDIQISASSWTQIPDQRKLSLVPSLGRVGPVQLDSNGKGTVTWTRPQGMTAAATLLLLLTDDAAPERALATLRVPIQLARATTFEVPPDAKVSLTVADTTTPDAVASPAGTVGVDLVLDPRVQTGTLTTTTPFGVVETQEVPLPKNAGAQTVLAPIIGSATRDPDLMIPIVVATDDGTGKPTSRPPKLTASAGTLVGAPTAGPHGTWTTLWRPPVDGDTVLFTVDSDAKRLQQRISLHPPNPRVTLEASPSPLPPGTSDFTVTLTATDPQGKPWAGELPALGVVQGETRGKAKSTATGVWTMAGLKGAGPMAMPFVEPPASSGAPPAQAPSELVAWVDTFSGDPTQPHLLRYAVVDSQGAGVGGIPVTVTVASGTAELTEAKPTWTNGMAYLVVTPVSAVPVTLALEAAGIRSTVTFFPGSKAPAATGSTRQQRLLAAWQAAAPAIGVAEEVPVVVAAAVPTAPTESPADASSTGPQTAKTAKDGFSMKPAKSGDTWGPAWLRVGARWQPITVNYTSAQKGSTGGPEGAAWFAGGLFLGDPFGGTGFGVNALARIGETPFVAELDIRRSSIPVGPDFSFPSWTAPESEDPAAEPLESPEDLYDELDWTWNTTFWRLGARYRLPIIDSLHGWGYAGLAHQEAVLFVWQDRAPSMTEKALWGARLGGGLTFETGRIWVDAGIGEVLAPWPVATEFDLDVEVGVIPQLAAHVGLDTAWRNMTYDLGGTDVDVGDQIHGINLGLVWTLR